MKNSALQHWQDRTDYSVARSDPYLRLQSVVVFVRDQDQSLKFYVDQLGFSVTFDSHFGEGERWVAVSPPDGTAMLALVAPKPNSEEYKLIGRFSHAVFLTEDVTARYVEWLSRGVRFDHPPKTPEWGGMFTSFEDPDGNSFVIVGFDELSRELEAHRRAIADQQEAERRSAQELEIAKQVQARLFPQTFPNLRTLEYAGSCIQARKVGGDYYDFLNLGEGRVGLIIADISGKGIAAALLMANLQANLRSQSAIALNQPESLLRSVNRLFYENTVDSAYATLFFAEYDDETRVLRYANCGHLSALVFRCNGEIERLDSTSTVLGLFEEWDCAIGELPLNAGDIFALYTDGITEAFNDAGEEFGEGRLVESLRQHRDLPIQGLVASIVDDVQQFSANEQNDDITLIMARCRR